MKVDKKPPGCKPRFRLMTALSKVDAETMELQLILIRKMQGRNVSVASYARAVLSAHLGAVRGMIHDDLATYLEAFDFGGV